MSTAGCGRGKREKRQHVAAVHPLSAHQQPLISNTPPSPPFPRRSGRKGRGKKCKFSWAGVALQRRTFTNKSNLHQNFIYLVLLLLCGFCAHSHRRIRMRGNRDRRNGWELEGLEASNSIKVKLHLASCKIRNNKWNSCSQSKLDFCNDL